MAWTKKLPSGKYQGLYRDGGGKERSAGTFPHKRAAQNAASAKEEASRTAGWRDPDAARRTWGEWCHEWWPTRKIEASTAANELSMRDQHLFPKWADVPLCDITRQDGRKWIAELSKIEVKPSKAELKRRESSDYKPVVRTLAAASVQRIFGLFSASLMAAVDAEVLPANPVYRLKLPQRPPAQERYLTKDEYQALDAVLDTKVDAAIVGLLVGTGLRWGEAMGLHAHRVDRERRMIHIVETYDYEAGMIKPYPKGKRARSVPLPDWVAQLLDEVDITPATSCGHDHRVGRCRSGLVLNAQGTMIDADNWRKRVWIPALEIAGIDHTRPHDLRHTYASWLIQSGVSIKEVGRLLGHASPVTTERYAHLAEIPAEQVTEALNLGVRTANVPQSVALPGYTALRAVPSQ
ncbi:tyrosine-type recombinase/integrase [Paenarthrobacter sp. NPDC090520]|uniref:tyrosine-type recombinase/integrase n=1 Tax=Paenarthrobacter sp. NPDC090520 TaxID=3364382 RepID=UPI00380D588B